MHPSPELSDDLVLSIDELRALQETQHRIAEARSVDDVVRLLLQTTASLIRSREVLLCLVDEEKGDFRICRRPERGHVFHAVTESSLLDNDLMRWVVRWERPSSIPMGPGRLMTVVPLKAQSHLIGVIWIDSDAEADIITRQVQELLTIVAGQAASVLLAVRLKEKFESQLATQARTGGFLRSIIESINHGIITVSPDLLIEQVNRNALAMLDVSWGLDAIGRKIDEIFPPDVVTLVTDITRETLENGFAMERRMDISIGNGPKIPVALSTSLLWDEAGARAGVVLIMRDMTASMELERLRNLDQMKSEFVANVSHELRTPLTCIKSYTEALKDMITEDPTAVKFLNVVDMESDRLIQLIENLLNTSLIESGRLKLDLKMVHPPELVEEVLPLSKLQSTKHPISVVAAADLPMVLVDKARMKEVMVNLIGNAIKYSPDGGAITVTMSVEDGTVRIDIADRGIGIPEEHRGKLFERFYRVDSSLTYKVSGTGLGLSIVKKVIEAHNGSIRVGDNPGGGSVFTIRLPLKTRTPAKFD